ncbi:hypothetical protein [Actinoplanes sp. NPDC049265]|uniref:hypothetical protein n=1 Tax=Actinoplanes sp. NPDC049265 TaxID=3363902 RepID=UPI0037238183
MTQQYDGTPPPVPPPAVPPPATGSKKKLWIGAAAVSALLLAGCCAGGALLVRSQGGKDAGGRDGSAVSPADYAKTLGEVDSSLKDPFAKLAAGDQIGYAKSAAGLRAGADKLDGVIPPESATGAHGTLVTALRGLADDAEDAAGAKPKCPAASPVAELLGSDRAEDIREQAKALAAKDATFRIGSFLPARPKEQNRRLATGTFVTKKSGSGSGDLVIENGAGDTTVSLVPKGTKKPNFTVYVRAKAKHTVKNIKSGTYEIFAAAGQDWDGGRKGFTRDCSFTKFDDDFKFEPGVIWTITLTQVVGGNASTSDVDPNSFPGS